MIGYYIHHQGAGHLHRARCIAAHCPVPMVGLSSLPRPEEWDGAWHQLPTDGPDDGPVADATAGGTLHWAPRHHEGVRQRARAVSAVLADPAIRLFVSDVSVEAAVLARLHAVPVVVVHQPGARDDRAHRMAYDLADGILAALPLPGPAWWPAAWHAKAHHVGAFSRFDHHTPHPGSRSREVLVLTGAGGSGPPDPNRYCRAAEATPGWRWTVTGAGPRSGATGPTNLSWTGWVDDLWPLLCSAEVIVTHAGQNALAEVAAARRPAIVIPEDRPFAEQTTTGGLLATVGPVLVEDQWPATHRWPYLLDLTAELDGDRWGHWSSGTGAAQAGRCLVDLCGAP